MEIESRDSKEYLHTFIGQKKNDRNQNNFFLISQKYSFTSNRFRIK